VTREQVHYHGAASMCCLSSLRPLPSHCLPQTLQDVKVELFIDCLTTWNKLIMNDTLPIKKKQSTAFTFERLWRPSLVVVTIFPSTATTELLFQHRRRTPKFHHLIWHFSENFYQHSNDQIPPDWLWPSSLFVHLSANAAQICCDTTHLQFVSQNPVERTFRDSCFFCNFTDSWATILTNQSKHFLNVFVVHWRGRPSRFVVVFDGRSARSETLVPLVTLATAQTILTILLQHLKSLRKSFSQFETEFDANALLLKILHVSTCKKSPRVLNTHLIKRTSLDD